MSDLTINDLRVEYSSLMAPRHLTPAEFDAIARREGWVKLEGIDWNALRLLHDHAAYALRQPVEIEAVEVLAGLIDTMEVALDADIARRELAGAELYVEFEGEKVQNGWCTRHDSLAQRHADGSWGCWWEATVEASGDHERRDFIPTLVVPLAALTPEED